MVSSVAAIVVVESTTCSPRWQCWGWGGRQVAPEIGSDIAIGSDGDAIGHQNKSDGQNYKV